MGPGSGRPPFPPSPLASLASGPPGPEAVTKLKCRAQGNGYTQLQNSGAMQGTFNISLPSTGDPSCDFFQQAYYQHIAAYFEMLGVNQLLETGFFNLDQLPPGFCNTFNQKYCSCSA